MYISWPVYVLEKLGTYIYLKSNGITSKKFKPISFPTTSKLAASRVQVSQGSADPAACRLHLPQHSFNVHTDVQRHGSKCVHLAETGTRSSKLSQKSCSAVYSVFQHIFPGQALSLHFHKCISVSWDLEIHKEKLLKIQATGKTPPKFILFREEE